MDTETKQEIRRAAQAAVGDKLREIIEERGGVVSDDATLPCLITKPQLLKLFGGISYVTLWNKMIHGDFPRGRTIHGRILWHLDEVKSWIERQPRQVLKGDPPATGGA